MSRGVINYGRNLVTREYVFLRDGEAPTSEQLSSEWVWWSLPPRGELAHKIGESRMQYNARCSANAVSAASGAGRLH